MQDQSHEEVKKQDKSPNIHVGWQGYLAFLFALMLFSGIFSSADNWLKMFDFNVLNGNFGTLADGKDLDFRGTGGHGARDVFLFAMELIPAVILALGIVNVVDGLGGLKAAQKLMTPILKPLLGLPGVTALASIANMQSTDAAAGMVKELYDRGEITDKERSILIAYQTSASAFITNYFSSGAAVFSFIVAPIIIPLIVMFVFKIIGGNLMRIYLKMFYKEDTNGGKANGSI